MPANNNNNNNNNKTNGNGNGGVAKAALIDFVAGSAGGVAQVLAGHPLDTIKPLGLYKGVQSPLIGLMVMNATLFFSYGQFKKLIQKDENAELTIPETVLAGAGVGLSVSFVEGPVDLFKSQLQVQYKGASQYNGFLDCAKKIALQHGVKGVYQGLNATLARDIIGNAAYFGTYEWARRMMLKEGETVADLSPWKVLMAGGFGGMMYWITTYPIDVVKSKIQTDSIIPANRKYRGLLDAVSQVFTKEGMQGFWRGFTPCLIRSFPANAVCFLAYEYSKTLLTSV